MIGRSRSFANLFLLQNYTNKAHGDVPLTVQKV